MQKFLALLMLAQFLSACPNDERCGACVNGRCELCWDSYLDVNGTCVEPQEHINECLRYENANQCRLCRDGYYLNANYMCESIQQDRCIRVDSLGVCVLCERGTRIQNGICDEANECKINNCDYCGVDLNGAERCEECREGYVIDQALSGNTTCVEAANSDEYDGCRYRGVSGQCAICKYGYYDNNGVCEESGAYSGSAIQIMSAVVAILFF